MRDTLLTKLGTERAPCRGDPDAVRGPLATVRSATADVPLDCLQSSDELGEAKEPAMSSALENVEAFHTWHSSRTWDAGHPTIDPWMRDVLVSLQSTLNHLAKQIDDNTARLNRIEQHLSGLQ